MNAQSVLALQRTAGNQAVSRMLADNQHVARCAGGGCSCGGKCASKAPMLDEEELRRGLSRKVASEQAARAR